MSRMEFHRFNGKFQDFLDAFGHACILPCTKPCMIRCSGSSLLRLACLLNMLLRYSENLQRLALQPEIMPRRIITFASSQRKQRASYRCKGSFSRRHDITQLGDSAESYQYKGALAFPVSLFESHDAAQCCRSFSPSQLLITMAKLVGRDPFIAFKYVVATIAM